MSADTGQPPPPCISPASYRVLRLESRQGATRVDIFGRPSDSTSTIAFEAARMTSEGMMLNNRTYASIASRRQRLAEAPNTTQEAQV